MYMKWWLYDEITLELVETHKTLHMCLAFTWKNGGPLAINHSISTVSHENKLTSNKYLILLHECLQEIAYRIRKLFTHKHRWKDTESWEIQLLWLTQIMVSKIFKMVDIHILTTYNCGECLNCIHSNESAVILLHSCCFYFFAAYVQKVIIFFVQKSCKNKKNQLFAKKLMDDSIQHEFALVHTYAHMFLVIFIRF